ncbi:unnamed protein product [Pleuronectes platessa]|uniref:Uncharacterized protein n=1 Tax=Pleuronectes platessa TaxID=8262 RepID=A0A9N7U491_PLEPL|nr:unnamed protein product [Pleuronectes platessa]
MNKDHEFEQDVEINARAPQQGDSVKGHYVKKGISPSKPPHPSAPLTPPRPTDRLLESVGNLTQHKLHCEAEVSESVGCVSTKRGAGLIIQSEGRGYTQTCEAIPADVCVWCTLQDKHSEGPCSSRQFLASAGNKTLNLTSEAASTPLPPSPSLSLFTPSTAMSPSSSSSSSSSSSPPACVLSFLFSLRCCYSNGEMWEYLRPSERRRERERAREKERQRGRMGNRHGVKGETEVETRRKEE